MDEKQSEAQQEYDDSPELQDLLHKADKATTVHRERLLRSTDRQPR